MTGIVDQVGSVSTVAVEAMKKTPLALALLLVNIAFLGLVAYVLGTVSGETALRNRMQMDLIGKLVQNIVDCRRAEAAPLNHLVPGR